mgnify:CR=1 FL=1
MKGTGFDITNGNHYGNLLRISIKPGADAALQAADIIKNSKVPVSRDQPPISFHSDKYLVKSITGLTPCQPGVLFLLFLKYTRLLIIHMYMRTFTFRLLAFVFTISFRLHNVRIPIAGWPVDAIY